MNVKPAIAFSANASLMLGYNVARSGWINDRMFLAWCDVAPVPRIVSNVSINVSGAYDAAGNLQAPYSAATAITLDMLDPPPDLAAVADAMPNVALVTDDNIGTAAFAVRITYTAAMNTNYNPAVTLSSADNPAGLASTLTHNPGQSWWVSSTAFVARYDVADADVIVTNATINIAGAVDATGNVQAEYWGPSAFTIDTLNLPPGALPLAVGRLSKSSYTVGRITNPSYADAVLSSGALNLTIGTVTSPTDQQAQSAPSIAHCCTAGRGWRCEVAGGGWRVASGES